MWFLDLDHLEGRVYINEKFELCALQARKNLPRAGEGKKKCFDSARWLAERRAVRGDSGARGDSAAAENEPRGPLRGVGVGSALLLLVLIVSDS